jgi:hypothetical protein
VKTIMLESGSALMGIGEASGENRASTAARMAVSSPLLEISISGAKGILYNIIGGSDMTMTEVSDASSIIAEAADADAQIIFGATIDESMGNKIKISVIATGFDERPGYNQRAAFGAYSRDSRRRMASIPSRPISEPESIDDQKIDRTPMGFTQPQTMSQISAGTEEPVSSSPFVRSAAFDKPGEDKPTSSATPATPDDDDEFEIPAFLRRK